MYLDERDFVNAQNKTGDFIGVGLSRSMVFPETGLFLSYKTNYEHFYASSDIETFIKRSFDLSTRQAINNSTFATIPYLSGHLTLKIYSLDIYSVHR